MLIPETRYFSVGVTLHCVVTLSDRKKWKKRNFQKKKSKKKERIYCTHLKSWDLFSSLASWSRLSLSKGSVGNVTNAQRNAPSFCLFGLLTAE
jgi:hypothetical protein